MELRVESLTYNTSRKSWKQKKNLLAVILGQKLRDLEPVEVFRVIDVQRKCVVFYDWDSAEPYYALSYVRGSRPFLTLNKANEADLRKEGSLSQDLLPNTIADAMKVVEDARVRYNGWIACVFHRTVRRRCMCRFIWCPTQSIGNTSTGNLNQRDLTASGDDTNRLSTLREDVVGIDFGPFIHTFAFLQIYATTQLPEAKLQNHFQDLITAYTKSVNDPPGMETLFTSSGDLEHTEVKIEDVSSLAFHIPLLCCWARSVTLELQIIGKQIGFKTRTGRFVSLGLRTFVDPGETEKLELIVLGDLSYLQPSAAPIIAVIVIRWECGIAYREPFGL
ncbi:hypothetical protein BT63DRAFT_415000 [Microthyrium microscopicum]|uniref:Heterokaryon incompatibility domain-containing protein n=1 Tax=Microthyrium microscopicum TaxID=703497 RepID=A0A6A6U951_9PEZI|nr:hypothetical protein BT63DRAFT_415000 [Microthyrium microscopicum]